MFEVYTKEIEWCGKKLKLETGRIARQAGASVLVTYEGTTVMANVTANTKINPEIDFFPLTVNYQEKFYSVGKIPGSFFKREGRPTEKETLICRLIDRPIRPLFHKDFKNEVQVICTVLSHGSLVLLIVPSQLFCLGTWKVLNTSVPYLLSELLASTFRAIWLAGFA